MLTQLNGWLGCAQLLEVDWGMRGSTKCAHAGLEFPVAECAERNCGSHTEPLEDSRVALWSGLNCYMAIAGASTAVVRFAKLLQLAYVHPDDGVLGRNRH